MRGKVTAITDTADGLRKLAAVELEGIDEPVHVAYWPELLEQWGAEKLRAWLVHQAVEAVAASADEDPHQALLGEAEPVPVEPPPPPPVCNLGASGCVVDHGDDELAAPTHRTEAVAATEPDLTLGSIERAEEMAAGAAEPPEPA
jgi:hypothetical protein